MYSAFIFVSRYILIGFLRPLSRDPECRYSQSSSFTVIFKSQTSSVKKDLIYPQRPGLGIDMFGAFEGSGVTLTGPQHPLVHVRAGSRGNLGVHSHIRVLGWDQRITFVSCCYSDLAARSGATSPFPPPAPTPVVLGRTESFTPNHLPLPAPFPSLPTQWLHGSDPINL